MPHKVSDTTKPTPKLHKVSDTTRSLTELLPLLSSSQAFLGATQSYHLAKLQQNAAGLDSARRAGLIALLDTAAEAGLLLTFLGKSSQLGRWVLRNTLLATFLTKLTRRLTTPLRRPIAQMDLTERLASPLLRLPHTQRTVDALFELVRTLYLAKIQLSLGLKAREGTKNENATASDEA